MKKILFVTTTLGGGGAERVLSYLLNVFSEDEEVEIVLLLLKKDGNTYLNSISHKVKIVNLCLQKRIRYAAIEIVRAIINIRPDICYVGLDKLNIMLAIFLPLIKLWKTRFIVRETNVLSQQYNAKNILIRLSYKLFYNQYDRIISQSKDMQKDLIEVWGIDEKKIVLINNPVQTEDIRAKSVDICPINFDRHKLNFVAIGRIVYQKGYDILLQRMAEVLPNTPFHLYILGCGPLQKEIKMQIDKLKLLPHVSLLGFQQNPYTFLQDCDGIILSSRYEGFPNVLVEANVLGIPVFANRCPGGINEIIVEGVNGISCNFENPEVFCKAFNEFVSISFNKKEIQELTVQRYDAKVILPQYKKVFYNVLRNS